MEYLVTLARTEENPSFPLELTDGYHERNKQNEALYTHVTSICLVTVGDRILCIDKRLKDRMKGKAIPANRIISLDLAGSGHGVRKENCDHYTFDNAEQDAVKELSEEIFLDGKPLQVDTGKLRFLGFAGHCSDSNREISTVWTYYLPEECAERLSCRDSVYADGAEKDFELPFYLLSIEELGELYRFSKVGKTVVIKDGIGRLLSRTDGDLQSIFDGGLNSGNK